MAKIQHLRKNEIYFPYGTSEWIGIRHKEDVLELTITAGGGMGGSKWTRLIKPKEIKEGLDWYETIDGDEISINSNYIVEVKKYQLICAEFLCTNRNFGLDNDLCEIKVLASSGIEPKLISEYKDMSDWAY